MTLFAVPLTLATIGLAATYASGDHAQRPSSGAPDAGTSHARLRVAQAAGIGRVSAPDQPSVRAAMFKTKQHCPGVQKAVGYYRRAYTRSRTAMGLDGAPPRVWYPCQVARRRAVEWRDRARNAARELARWTRNQFEWWRWMPRGSKWYRVASCETGYGQDPNWSHDSGTYVSAFGIYRPGYADDAHRVGNMSWDETVRARGTVPTPREQFEAALSHYRAHGGFSGWGCRGA